MIPDYSGSNPYQTALIDGLRDHAVTVDSAPVEGLFPILGGWYRHGRPDVLHLHWVHTFLDTEHTPAVPLLGVRLLFELLILKLFGTTVVWTVHNTIAHEARLSAVRRLIRHVVARLADRIIVHCVAAKAVIRDSYGLPSGTLQTVRVVPHGHYLESYPNEIDPEDARERLGISNEVTVLSFFGLIRPYKNVTGLLSTFLSIEDPDIRLLVAGRPWNDTLREEIETIARTDDRILTELAYIPDEEVQTYLNASDAIVLPFESVLTSGSAILGMSFGRALVVADTGCVGELVDRSGAITFAPDEESGLRSALERTVHRRDDLTSMGRHNRAAIEQYDWGSIADRTRQIYLSAINRR